MISLFLSLKENVFFERIGFEQRVETAQIARKEVQ